MNSVAAPATEAAGHTASGLRVLVADDNQTDRLILAAIVRKEGHEVVTAVDGQDAVEKFTAERPDLVLLDALMPRLDGFEVARQIKAMAGDELVPIIFLTSLQEAGDLARCLDAGGDDFLTKPYNKVILRAKIHAFERMRHMHATLLEQKQQIAEANAHLMQEQEVAKAVFDNVAHSGALSAGNIRSLVSPLAVFNGDVLLASRTPSGGMHVLLGDFTGHGLPAAIGAMPTADIFYGMTAKGFAPGDILAETNRKLKAILPVGVFCCAVFVELDFGKRLIKVWNGGLPDAILYRPADGSIERLPSANLPLGVLPKERFSTTMAVFPAAVGDRVFAWSDGIIEARSPDGEMFGEERLLETFSRAPEPDAMFDAVVDTVYGFCGEGEMDDDVTLLEVRLTEPSQAGGRVVGSRMEATAAGPKDWHLTLELGPSSLKEFNPLPMLQQVLLEVPGLRTRSGELSTVLSELYCNALEHGVLGLDSVLKADPKGFGEYYMERSRRLARLEDGFIRVEFHHEPTDSGGRLRVRFLDSGEGFDFLGRMADAQERQATGAPSRGIYSGRGIPLMLTICADVTYSGCGNDVEAIFEWHWPH